MGAYWGPHSNTFYLFIELTLERKVSVLRQNSSKRIMSLTGNTVLSFRVLSFSSRSLIMSSAGSTGTQVNRAVTSYELRHSPGISVTLLACATKSWVLWMWWGTYLPVA